MDLNKTIEFSTSSASVPVQDSQMHNFMSMPAAFMSPNNHQQYVKDGEAARNHRFKQLLKQNIQLFWNQRMYEIRSASEFRTHHQLPLARVKKIMKADEGVKMISADTPVLFAKACELFILELTLRSWLHTEENKRRTLQRSDIARAVRNEKLLDFLTDVVPLDHKLLQEEVTRSRSEGNESHHPASRTHLPMANLNSAYIMRNQEIPQQFVFQPSISSAEYQAGSKGKLFIKPQ